MIFGIVFAGVLAVVKGLAKLKVRLAHSDAAAQADLDAPYCGSSAGSPSAAYDAAALAEAAVITIEPRTPYSPRRAQPCSMSTSPPEPSAAVNAFAIPEVRRDHSQAVTQVALDAQHDCGPSAESPSGACANAPHAVVATMIEPNTPEHPSQVQPCRTEAGSVQLKPTSTRPLEPIATVKRLAIREVPCDHSQAATQVDPDAQDCGASAGSPPGACALHEVFAATIEPSMSDHPKPARPSPVEPKSARPKPARPKAMSTTPLEPIATVKRLATSEAPCDHSQAVTRVDLDEQDCGASAGSPSGACAVALRKAFATTIEPSMSDHPKPARPSPTEPKSARAKRDRAKRDRAEADRAEAGRAEADRAELTCLSPLPPLAMVKSLAMIEAPCDPNCGASAGSPSDTCAATPYESVATMIESNTPGQSIAEPWSTCTRSPEEIASVRVLYGPEPDGSTQFRCVAPQKRWSRTITKLRQGTRRKQKTATLPAADGEAEVEVALQFKRGELHLSGRGWDLYVSGRKARLELRTEALGTESLENWYVRVFPLVTRLLFGVQLKWQSIRSLIDQLQALGWRTSALELALDMVGFPIKLATREAIVSQIKWGHDHGKTGTKKRHCLDVGSRESNPLSLSIYDKLAKLKSHPIERAVWEAKARAAGWRGEPVTRVEFRFRDEALILGRKANGEPEVDGSHVGAPLDAEVCGRLWVYACMHTRLVDVEEGDRRGVEHTKNCPPLPQWEVVLAAGQYAGERLVRIAPVVELEARRKSADQDLRRAAVRRAVLDGATTAEEVRTEVVEHLERVLAMPEVTVDVRRSLARYAELLEQAKKAELTEQTHASDVVTEDPAGPHPSNAICSLPQDRT